MLPEESASDQINLNILPKLELKLSLFQVLQCCIHFLAYAETGGGNTVQKYHEERPSFSHYAMAKKTEYGNVCDAT